MQPKYTRLLLLLCLLFSSLLFISSCQKEISGEINNPSFSQPITVEGIVTEPNGIPLQNVLIKAGTMQIMTDVNGSFHITNSQFSTTERFVTASKSGYFMGSRTFFPTAGSNNFIRIQLLPRTEIGTVNASTGGTVSFSSVALNFPANAFANQDGTAYSGTVSIRGAYIDPTNPSLDQQMPGDLRGTRTNGDLRGLRTFGMVNVEMEGSGGAILKIKTGSSVQLTMPIPVSLMSVAPATIPLWYFDETTGLWKEEGTAQKNGNAYTGTVTHFTFWNVDDPFQYVMLDMRIVNQLQQPIGGALVELTSVTDSSTAFDYTDMNGLVNGYVPVNVQLRRDIYNECNALVSTSLIGPFSADTDLGIVSVTSLTDQQTITGTVTDCNNLPLTNGYVIISMAGNTVYANVTNGIFNTTFTSCSSGGTATIIAVDQTTQQQGSSIPINLNTPVVAAGNIQACGTSVQEFITIIVDGVTRTWSTAPHDLYAEEDPFNQGGFYEFYVGAFDTATGGSVDLILFRSVDSTVAPFTMGIQSLSIWDPLAAPNMIGDYFLDNTLPVIPGATLTQYGAVGQIIEGSFSASFIKSNPPNVDTVDVTLQFKIRRE